MARPIPARRRTREIGIRIALGANRGDVFALIMKQGVQQTVASIAAGIALSLATGRAQAAVFFQVKPNDIVTLACPAVILTTATRLACFLPAKHVMRVGPLNPLRAEQARLSGEFP